APFSLLFGSTIGGQFFAGSGKVTVDGLGSNWTHTGPLTIGGTGQLLISNAGTVASSGGTRRQSFCTNALASATVTGPGSRWTNTDVLTVGGDSSGSLTIANGGVVTSTAGAIGAGFSFNGPISAVTVSGPGSTWSTTGILAVGGRIISLSFPFPSPGGAGTLNIGPGGAVRVGTDITVYSQGKINLQGGDLYANSITLSGTPATLFSWTSGTLHVGTFGASLVNSAGVLAPGQSPGKTTINGTYTQQASATLQIEIAGTTSGTQYDFVSIGGTGNSTLGGTL